MLEFKFIRTDYIEKLYFIVIIKDYIKLYKIVKKIVQKIQIFN